MTKALGPSRASLYYFKMCLRVIQSHTLPHYFSFLKKHVMQICFQHGACSFLFLGGGDKWLQDQNVLPWNCHILKNKSIYKKQSGNVLTAFLLKWRPVLGHLPRSTVQSHCTVDQILSYAGNLTRQMEWDLFHMSVEGDWINCHSFAGPVRFVPVPVGQHLTGVAATWQAAMLGGV